MNAIHTAIYKSEIGFLKITGAEDGLYSLEFMDEKSIPQTEVHPCLKECYNQLDEYFQGERKVFNLELKPEGTEFQMRVWQQLFKIPYGHTASYMEIASSIGNKKAIRAVGTANGRNKIPIIIPCHRVIGSDGSLTGFGGGIWRKEFLLKHEKIYLI